MLNCFVAIIGTHSVGLRAISRILFRRKSTLDRTQHAVTTCSCAPIRAAYIFQANSRIKSLTYWLKGSNGCSFIIYSFLIKSNLCVLMTHTMAVFLDIIVLKIDAHVKICYTEFNKVGNKMYKTKVSGFSGCHGCGCQPYQATGGQPIAF